VFYLLTWGQVTSRPHSARNLGARLVLLLLPGLLGPSLVAQVAVSVTDTTGWNAWAKADLSLMSEITTDQQTGQGADDFAADGSYAGFYQKAGTIGGADHILFRARFDKFDGADQWGIGMDVNGDGAVDLIMMMSEASGNPNNRARTLTFGDPGAGANTGPSTTTWTFPTQTAINLVTNSTYDVHQTTDGSMLNGTADMFLSFAVSFANLQAAIRAYTPQTTFTMSYDTRMSYIGFTSTQANSLNQDLFGTTGNTRSTLTWAQLGAITGPANAWGVVPEPATYVQMAMFVLAGGLVAYRRRKAARAPVAR
jgi:hypothetical protein